MVDDRIVWIGLRPRQAPRRKLVNEYKTDGQRMRYRIETSEAGSWVRPVVAAGTFVYLATCLALAWHGRQALMAPIENFRPQLNWGVEATRQARLAMLSDAGQPVLAFLYARLELLSGLFILFAVAVGLIGACARSPRPDSDPITLMMLTVWSILSYAVYANGPTYLHMLFAAEAMGSDVGAIPAVWCASMALTAIAMAWAGSLLAHDLAISAMASRPGRQTAHS
jgi:hypothetical protein